MAVRGGLSPLSRLIFEIVYSIGQGNFTFIREKSGKVREFQKPLPVATMIYMVLMAVNLPPFPLTPDTQGS